MKLTINIILLMTIVPELLWSQTLIQNHRLITTQVLQRPTRFRVTNHAEDTTARTTVIRTFRLNPGEKKAVAQTGSTITKLDRSVLKIPNDTVSHAKMSMLPELYYARVGSTEEEQVSYRILIIDSAPLRYDFKRELFEGSIRFLPVEVNNSGNEKLVEKPLSVPENILVSYGLESIPLSITRINWPPQDVTITSPDPRDSVEVKILTVSNPLGYPIKLSVEPAIILSSTRNVIQGLGIQTLPVHVSLKGISSYRPVPLTVESSLGTIQSASLSLSDDQPREVNLRSESIGRIDLRIVNPNYRSNSIHIEAVFPWLFLLLSVMGGLIGALGNDLMRKEKITLRSLTLGGIIGLIVAVAYWGLGIKLIDFSFETSGLNEAMVLALGLIAGFYGLKLVKQ